MACCATLTTPPMLPPLCVRAGAAARRPVRRGCRDSAAACRRCRSAPLRRTGGAEAAEVELEGFYRAETIRVDSGAAPGVRQDSVSGEVRLSVAVCEVRPVSCCGRAADGWWPARSHCPGVFGRCRLRGGSHAAGPAAVVAAARLWAVPEPSTAPEQQTIASYSRTREVACAALPCRPATPVGRAALESEPENDRADTVSSESVRACGRRFVTVHGRRRAVRRCRAQVTHTAR